MKKECYLVDKIINFDKIDSKFLPEKEITFYHSIVNNDNQSHLSSKKEEEQLNLLQIDNHLKPPIKNDILKINLESIIQQSNDKIELSPSNSIIKKEYREKLLESKILHNDSHDLHNLLDAYFKSGFSVKPKKDSVITSPFVIPDQYSELVQQLSVEYPGIKFKESVSLADKSQHNVDILTFEYQINGQTQYLHVVVKDRDEKEEVIPQFLSDLGIITHSVYDAKDRLLLEHVGIVDLRDIVRDGSEHEMVHACDLALGKIAQIHTLASEHLDELHRDYGLVLPFTNYVSQFRDKFLLPASGNSQIISPQIERLMQVYSSFVQGFNPNSFSHGDFHSANCRIADDQCFVFDYEWSNVGRRFDDLARFTNSVLRDRPSLDQEEVSRHMFKQYIKSHNFQDTPSLLPTDLLYNAFELSMINDELYKIGEYISFAQSHPSVADEKMQKSTNCLTNTLRMLDSHPELSPLKSALLDFAAISPYQGLRQAAVDYQRPVLRLVA